MSEAQTTTDHSTIQKWAEDRRGRPATVAATQSREAAGILRIDFEPGDEPGLNEISWDDFFEKFDEAGLAFLYQDKTADGSVSRFHKFIDRSQG